MESIEKQFFFSQYQVLDVIRETAQNKVERIFYNPRQSVCVLKIYYGRNLEAIYLKLKKIHHLNLATVYDVLYCDGNTYIVEENIDGETLAEHLQMEGVFSEKEVISIIKEICDGLVCRQVDFSNNLASKFLISALSSVAVATATPHSSALK